MPTNSQPPPKPPAKGSLETASDGDLETGLDERVKSLRSAVLSVLKGTEWPPDSSDAADSLINTVNSCPDITTNRSHATKELQTFVEKYTETLDEIHIRLRDASSKSAMKRWKLLQLMKSIASKRPSKCALLFQTCQDDLLKAMDAVNERLEKERAKEASVVDGLESSPEAQLHSSGPGVAQSLEPDPPTDTAEQESTSDDSTQNSLILRGSQSTTPNTKKRQIPMSDEALSIARKAFKSVEIGSGAIPVVGSYIGAVAKVGLAFVETLQTMDRNDSLAIDLGNHTSKLNKLVQTFKRAPNMSEKDMADQIDALHGELVLVNEKVEEWNSLGRFKKAFSARDHGEMLKDHQARIQTAREEMQLLVGVDSRNIIIDVERRRLLNRLGDGQYGARGNTIEDIICFPGTRLEILKEIDHWIEDTASANPVLWIRGMAGRGKSTIASTVVHSRKYPTSCAIFHFRRGQSALNSRVICALARQLGSSLVSAVKNAVLESVRENEDIADPGRRLDEQFEKLFVTPFSKLKQQSHPILIVLDALDECDNPKDAVDLVRLIHKHSPSFPNNVKFLLTCRPEAPILRNLEPRQWPKADLDSAAGTNDDLARFIEAACNHIRDEHSLSEDWPSAGHIEQLVQMSQGLFQWARTAITYLGDGSPVDRLGMLLDRPAMWRGLDELYHQILSKAFTTVRLDDDRRDILCQVVGILAVAPYPVSLEVIATVHGRHPIFAGANQQDIIQFLRKDILADLNSLLFIPQSPTETMRLMHTSIRDLVVSKKRCEQRLYYIDIIPCHRQLASICLDILLEQLKENICTLVDVWKPSSEVQDVAEREISSGLRYCCRAWPTHLTEGVRVLNPAEGASNAELALFDSFSKEKLMCWLEVMSLIGATKEAITSARLIYQWLLQLSPKKPQYDHVAGFWNDAQRFITTFFEPISFGPLHIYISALPHCPTETEIWKIYGSFAKIRTVHGQRMSTWPSNLWTRSQNAEVRTVAFSPNGRVVAFGSDDRTIRLLDAQTGTEVGEPLTGHSGMVLSVSFSPDGKLLASGSWDSTVRFWDAETREAVGEPLIGHTGQVNCVCFLPNGKVLASGAGDGTVRLWSTETGAAMGQPLTGHSQSLSSVCFSPDGKLLASGSWDKTVRLWDPHAGVAVGEPLEGHSDGVRSVCFSPDGNLLASGSSHGTILLWNPKTRTTVGEPLTGHSGTIFYVRFSPDGKVLASGGGDGTIRLWDALTGTAVGEPLIGHNGWVRSLDFSPDGRTLVSGSEDATVRLWDLQAGAAVAGSLTRHHSTVHSACFSPNGKHLASGSSDGTIRLWDPCTGAAVGDPPIGHSSEVNCVCFSPDGRLLASGSDDWTVRLWDVQTGFAMRDLLLHSEELVLSVCFSPDGRLLATGSSGGTIRLWDPQTGVAACEPLTGHSGWVRSVCFSPDGKYLASGSDDRTIRLWDPKTGLAVGEPLEGHTGFVISVSFSSDGRLLMARCYDGSSTIWDVTTRQRCDTPRGPLSYANPIFQDHWVSFDSFRFFWLPPQYWDVTSAGVALFGGMLAAFPNGSLTIFDLSQVLPI